VLAGLGLYGEGGPLDDQAIVATIEYPAQAVVGFRFGLTSQIGLMADYQWTGWSSFDKIIGDFANEGVDDLELTLNYVDTHTFRVGADFQAGDALELRGGFIYNTAASPDETVTPILPEAERQLYTVGFGYDFGTFRADAYYNYVNQADRRGRVRSALPGSFTIDDLNIGVYSTTAHLVGLTLSYVFGHSD
jgi:long-chain fatty acid transport protein